MALVGRYSTIDKAIITTIGNSLVLCGDTKELIINTSDMITPEGGTTRNYSTAGSSGNLNILDKSTILYAELVWLSTVKSNALGATDVRSIQDNPITFITPKETLSISPDYTYSYTSPLGTIDRLRAAEITNHIKNSLNGTYTVTKVPTSIPATGLSEVRCGWALTVIYRNTSFKPKRIVYALGIEAATSSSPIQASFTGFKTEGNKEYLKGKLITVFANGNPLDGTDILKVGPSFAELTVIGNSVGKPNANPGTAPNNPWNSFSSGQINMADTTNGNKGLIDISGTKGTVNHDAFVPTQVQGARNKWDITCVDISNSLIVNQTQLSGQYTLTNSENSIELVAFGAQIDSKAPDIIATLDAYDIDGDNEYNVNLNEPVIYMVQIKNSGKTVANNVTLSVTLDPALQFVTNSVTINGSLQTGADITKSINIGNLEPSGVANINFTLKAVSLVQSGSTANTTVTFNYSFNSDNPSTTYINYDKTNTLNLIVQDGNLNVLKKVSSNKAKLGDTIIYTNEITNIGSEKAVSVFFQDKINSYCSFVPESVKINGIDYPDFNPNNGFSLSDLASNAKTVIDFSVNVNTLSPNTIVENGALVTFSYIFNQYLVPVTKTILSNTTNIQIEFSEIMGIRTADNYYPSVGDNVTYTLKLTNIGNIAASNVTVIEPPIAGTQFVDGSVYINGVRKLGLNPFTGFTVDNISAQSTSIITYEVLVNVIQPDEIIENIAKVPFKYQVSSEEPIISSEKISNKVTTRTNYVIMHMAETVDKAYATIDDILYYSINVTNTGNIDALNTTFLSSIQTEATFIPNTVSINGVPQPGYNPNLGFSLGVIAPDNTVNVSFQATVNSVPNPNIIYNVSELVYNYKPDPNGAPVTETLTSNKVQTIINNLSFDFIKYVDKAYAVIGEYLIYKCLVRNTGTVTLNNVYFNDELSTYTKFEIGSVYVNGINYINYDPNTGFSIGTIKADESIEVLFGVQVIKAPPFGYVMNVGDMTYSYKVNPNSPTITKTEKTNTVQTKVVDGNLKLTKYSNLSYATLGDTINYFLEISNVGNVTVNEVFFFDEIPSGVTFVSNSVTVNSISKPDFNPVTGFNIGSLNAGQVATISFFVTVTTIPSPNTITNNGSATYSFYVIPEMSPVSKTSTSNNVTTVINKASVTLTKVVDKAYATINDIITYTITAHNTGTVTLDNMSFVDFIATGATFLKASVIINEVSYPAYDPNLGFALPSILPSSEVIVSFKANINSVPTPPIIDNHGSISYKYKINPSGEDYTGSATSNTVTTNINLVAVTNNKNVDKLYAEVNDTLTYTSVIKNNGNTNITDTIFTDILDSNLTFSTGSVTINGISYSNYNPTNGFTLGTIRPNETYTVIFDVTVSTLPERGYVENKSTLYYKYKINPEEPDILANTESNTVTTNIISGTLSIVKNTNRAYARLTDALEYSFIITNTGNTLLSNLFFQDTIQAESTFIAGTLYIDGTKKDNYNPNTGFILEDLSIGKYTTIAFTVIVNSLPTDGKLYNTGNINYSYFVDPAKPVINKNVISNKTTVTINDAIISANKTVDKSIAKVGNSVTYTVSIYNSGNASGEFVKFTDLLDKNMTFNEGTVTVNGDSKPTYNPNVGFSLENIAAKATTTVSFTATVTSRPEDNIIKNFATIDYKYKVNVIDPYFDVTINTNTTITNVAAAELTLDKVVDKIYATVKDTLTYTVKITNTGSVNATNLVFKDPSPENTNFIPNTVVIDGKLEKTLNINAGFALSDLVPNQYHTVSFDVEVHSLPESGVVENIADTTFDYKLLPTDETQSITSYSNKATTYINLGKINVTKAVNNSYATLNDTLTYTITLENVGNVTCKNIFFQDIIQIEGSFIDSSLKINGITKPTYNPNAGFSLEDISKGDITTITFDVVVMTLPVDYHYKNSAAVNYKYTVDPNNEPIATAAKSNTVTTNIRLGALTVTKETNKAYATIDETVSYTVNIINTGNADAFYVNFRDVIPFGLTFVKDSVKVNGDSKPGLDPYQSFTLGNILAGGSVIVSFDTTVTSIPSPSLITNTANIVYSFKINPNEDYIVKKADSNAATTQINLGKLTLTKSVDKAYATIGDMLFYTIEVENTGNVDATNVRFSDILPSDATFITDSVTINGETKPNYNPTTGFILDSIVTLKKSIVTFKAVVSTLPPEYTIINSAIAVFSYKINPQGETYTKSAESNTVSTIIISAGLSATKIVNLSYATIDDILEYTITVKNTGNTPNKSLFFKDILSTGAIFETGTVVINEISKPTYNPMDGFSLPDLSAGNTAVVVFKAKVTSVPNPTQVTNFAAVNGVYKINPEGQDYPVSATSNTVSTQINVGSLTNIKVVNKLYAKVEDTLTYTSTISNVGNISTLDVWFFDNLQTEVQFITGTVIIDNVTYPSLDPTVGFTLGDLALNQIVVVSFDAKIKTLPVPPKVTNKSQAQYNYKINPMGNLITKTIFSNNVETNVVKGELSINKTVDKSIATIGDILVYNISLLNTGNVIAQDIFFQDTPSTGATFKTGSVIVNGEAKQTLDPTLGFILTNLAIGNITTVQFTAIVTSVPSTNKITNQAVVNFKFVVDPIEPPVTTTTYSNTTTTNIALGTLNVTKAVDKKYATIGEYLTYTIVIENTGNINATNVIFLDSTPDNSIFVLGSVTVNGESKPSYNPAVGFALNTMKPGELITVVYKVQVV
jgi:uncharacterized repeat protein (TIGR01451 family)